MGVWDTPARLWSIARKVEDLLELNGSIRVAIAAIDTRLRAVEDRMTHLEADQGKLIIEAKAAAGVAATGLAGSVISDVVTRVTRIEMRQEDLHRRLPRSTEGAGP
jgi:hypothetical protein